MNRPAMRLVGATGGLAVVLLAAGLETVGGAVALVQLGLLVGGLPARLLGGALRSRAARVVLSVTLSLAITALAVQSLMWFRLATAELIVVTATAYAIVLTALLDSFDGGADQPRPLDGIDSW